MLTTVQLRGSTSLISCRSARADFLHRLRFPPLSLCRHRCFLLFSTFPRSSLSSPPANRRALVAITSRTTRFLASIPEVIALDSCGKPWKGVLINIPMDNDDTRRGNVRVIESFFFFLLASDLIWFNVTVFVYYIIRFWSISNSRKFLESRKNCLYTNATDVSIYP